MIPQSSYGRSGPEFRRSLCDSPPPAAHCAHRAISQRVNRAIRRSKSLRSPPTTSAFLSPRPAFRPDQCATTLYPSRQTCAILFEAQAVQTPSLLSSLSCLAAPSALLPYAAAPASAKSVPRASPAPASVPLPTTSEFSPHWRREYRSAANPPVSAEFRAKWGSSAARAQAAARPSPENRALCRSVHPRSAFSPPRISIHPPGRQWPPIAIPPAAARPSALPWAAPQYPPADRSSHRHTLPHSPARA